MPALPVRVGQIDLFGLLVCCQKHLFFSTCRHQYARAVVACFVLTCSHGFAVWHGGQVRVHHQVLWAWHLAWL